jgi:GrpB-like predicted nucleotidyltransferase (UPF0157 family)
VFGLQKNFVRLVSHRKEWDQNFQLESAFLLLALGDYVMSIEHIGSTAVEGIIAKPIIDILVGINDFNEVFKHIPVLEILGYEFRAESGEKERQVFGKGNPRLFHLHIVRYESANWFYHINFRNILINDPEIRRNYALLKMNLAKKYPTDRMSYTEGKSEFIRTTLLKYSST